MEKRAPVFETAADRTLNTVRATYAQRGGEYADSWALENLTTTMLDATLARFHVELSPQEKRLLMLAAMIDVKDSRLGGPFKADSIIDGVAYRAVYCALREDFESNASE